MKKEETLAFTLMLWFFTIPDGLPHHHPAVHSGCLMLTLEGWGEGVVLGGAGGLKSRKGHPVNSTAGKRSRSRQGETTVST